MHLNFIIKRDGSIVLAQIFTNPQTLKPFALTAIGELLIDEEFYILPSNEKELLNRNIECVKKDGFNTQKLEEIQLAGS